MFVTAIPKTLTQNTIVKNHCLKKIEHADNISFCESHGGHGASRRKLLLLSTSIPVHQDLVIFHVTSGIQPVSVGEKS